VCIPKKGACMFIYFDRLTPSQQGIVGMIFGVLLLLFALGAFQSILSLIIILSALVMIVSGFIQSGLYDMVIALTKKKHNK
jgi:hypothetical protein